MTKPGGGPLVSVGYWLHHAALAWRREMDTRLRPLGLTHTQFDVLASISWLGRESPPTQQAVADFAGTDRMMTSKIIKTLLDHGLVQRRPDPVDGRANRLSLTSDGRATVTASTATARAVDAEMFGDLPDPVALRRTLTSLVDAAAAQ